MNLFCINMISYVSWLTRQLLVFCFFFKLENHLTTTRKLFKISGMLTNLFYLVKILLTSPALFFIRVCKLESIATLFKNHLFLAEMMWSLEKFNMLYLGNFALVCVNDVIQLKHLINTQILLHFLDSKPITLQKHPLEISQQFLKYEFFSLFF